LRELDMTVASDEEGLGEYEGVTEAEHVIFTRTVTALNRTIGICKVWTFVPDYCIRCLTL
jgi:hypothetical protein